MASKHVEAASMTIDFSQVAVRSLWGMAWDRFRRHWVALAGTIVLLIIIMGSVAAPVLRPYDPDRSNIKAMLEPPSLTYPMGTDELGRDQLTRILYGGRVSLTIGLLSMVVAVVIGTLVGAVAGYYGGLVDNILMRVTDLVLSFPRLFVLILLSSLLGPSIRTIVLTIGLLSWMDISRLVRASFLSLKRKEFIEAARSYGAGNARIAIRHLMPNALSPVIVSATLGMARAIVSESGLSYLGLGVQPPAATWGTMLRNAQDQMATAPWTAVFPGLMIFVSVMAINFMGDGLRDALDPTRTVHK
jgi:peptide/nickel transport system permease protein